jgi:hypothetical protein
MDYQEDSVDGTDFSDEWTDLDDDEPAAAAAAKRTFQPVHPVLSSSVRRRVRALKKKQFETETLEAKFYRELFFLEARFNATHKEPIYDYRNQVRIISSQLKCRAYVPTYMYIPF